MSYGIDGNGWVFELEPDEIPFTMIPISPMDFVPFWITSIYDAALYGEWPLRCEMKPKPSTRLADDLPE